VVDRIAAGQVNESTVTDGSGETGDGKRRRRRAAGREWRAAQAQKD
tara:strand:+ start:806 stop:943 length:138 start_codon:yes stop_codon:yes gene_type:complete